MWTKEQLQRMESDLRLLYETQQELRKIAAGEYPEIEGYNGAYVDKQAVSETADNALKVIEKLQKRIADYSWATNPERMGR